jgi:hypothetical protein
MTIVRRTFGVAVVLAAAGIALLVFATTTLDLADKWASVGSFALGVAGLVLGVLALRQDRQTTTIAQRLDRLAEVVDLQWRDEAESRGLGTALLTVRLAGVVDDKTTLAQLFRTLPTRRLVVLGEPGAGKTVLAIRLVRELLRHREPGDPVPVLFTLGSWNPEVDPHPHAWMAGQLAQTYPTFRSVALELLRARHILPVLDGLDEVPDHLREAAVQAINRIFDVVDHADRDPLVLTCRREEYRDRLVEATVVELCPLRAEDIAPHFPGITWEPVLATLRTHPDGALARALSTPLTVSLARTAVTDPGELLRFTDQAEIEEHLLGRFVSAVYGEKQVRWLRFLARQRTPDIAWWRFVHEVPRAVIVVVPALVAALAITLVVGAMGLDVDAAVGFGLAVGAVSVLFGFKRPHPEVTAIRLSGRGLRVRLAAALGGLLIGLLFGSIVSLAAAIVCGLASGLIWGLVSLSDPADTVRATSPAMLLRDDRVVALLSGLPLPLVLGLVTGFATTPLKIPLGVVVFWLIYGAPFALSTAWGRFALARCWLALRGRSPLRLMAFLADAHRRGVLRRVGAVYQFRHARLRDHLASTRIVPAHGR